MVNQNRGPTIEGISEDNPLTQETGQVLPVETLGIVVDPQRLIEGVETCPAETLGVVEVRQRSNPVDRMHLMVWTEAGETQEWRVIVEVPVVRACPNPGVAEAEEVSPAVAVVVVEVPPAVAGVVVAAEGK
jgi:hypothetical protein